MVMRIPPTMGEKEGLTIKGTASKVKTNDTKPSAITPSNRKENCTICSCLNCDVDVIQSASLSETNWPLTDPAVPKLQLRFPSSRNPLPNTVTTVPPSTLPMLGMSPLTIAGSTYSKDTPPLAPSPASILLKYIFTSPSFPSGVTHSTLLADSTCPSTLKSPK